MERKQSLRLQCMIRSERKNRKELYPVYLRITVGGIRAEIATNVMVARDKWNATKGRLNGTVSDTRQANQQLDNFEHRAREIYNRCLLEGKNVTAEESRMKLPVLNTTNES